MSRLRLIFGSVVLAVIAVVGVVGSAAPAAAQDGCDSNPPVTCPDPPTTGAEDPTDPEPTDPEPTDPPDTTPTTEPTTTTTESTTTTAAPVVTTTTVPPTTAPPTTMPTTAPPELEPEASTTTALVGELTKITQDTPSLSGVVMLVLLGVAGTAAVLGTGYINNRR